MSNFSPHDCFRQVPGVRLREVPEWGCLLVYTPADPNVHYLDARSWLIYELCDGRSRGRLLAEFAEAVPIGTTPEAAAAALDEGLTSLIDNGIVERGPAASAAPPAPFVGSTAG